MSYLNYKTITLYFTIKGKKSYKEEYTEHIRQQGTIKFIRPYNVCGFVVLNRDTEIPRYRDIEIKAYTDRDRRGI